MVGMISINDTLSSINLFKTISLSEMEKIKLMDRVDLKYVIPINRISEILDLMRFDYLIQKNDEKIISNYKTTYYDTIDYKMYLEHHNERYPRQKIRTRKYLDKNESYLEIKNKNNKKRTNKKRIEIDFINQEKAINFINNTSNYKYEDLSPSIETNFSRITIVNKSFKERITIDFNIFFNNPRTNLNYNLDKIAILELKQEGRESSKTKEILNSLRIHPSSFSKSCIGQVLTNPDIKQNLFKTKIINTIK
ncbi:MAG: hypothetical protein H6Q16_1489 [Bacteroidetes bacterium]|nr:hypothetical protein [Bacteroidota bacterium]